MIKLSAMNWQLRRGQAGHKYIARKGFSFCLFVDMKDIIDKIPTDTHIVLLPPKTVIQSPLAQYSLLALQWKAALLTSSDHLARSKNNI